MAEWDYGGCRAHLTSNRTGHLFNFLKKVVCFYSSSHLGFYFGNWDSKVIKVLFIGEDITINKACTNHKPLMVTELSFCNKAKANGKIILGFCRGNQDDANFWSAKIFHHFSALLWGRVWELGCSHQVNQTSHAVVNYSRSTPANSIHSFVKELLLHECVSVLPQGSFISCGQL